MSGDLAPRGKGSTSMRTFYCSLLSASLLAHAVLGCCRHDVEASGACVATSMAQLAANECCHRDDIKPHENGQHEPCKDHPHCQGMCNYLPAQKPQIEECQLRWAFDAAYSSELLECQQLVDSSWTVLRVDRGSHAPLRLHLLHQILLI